MSQAVALVLTWALELATAVALTGRRDLRLVVVVVVASLLTHPFVWWVGTHAPASQWWPRILATELVVAVVEGVFVRVAAREPRGVVVGVAMNAVSFAVGLLLAPWL
jgi:hypothetical protein